MTASSHFDAVPREEMRHRLVQRMAEAVQDFELWAGRAVGPVIQAADIGGAEFEALAGIDQHEIGPVALHGREGAPGVPGLHHRPLL